MSPDKIEKERVASENKKKREIQKQLIAQQEKEEELEAKLKME